MILSLKSPQTTLSMDTEPPYHKPFNFLNHACKGGVFWVLLEAGCLEPRGFCRCVIQGARCTSCAKAEVCGGRRLGRTGWVGPGVCRAENEGRVGSRIWKGSKSSARLSHTWAVIAPTPVIFVSFVTNKLNWRYSLFFFSKDLAKQSMKTPSTTSLFPKLRGAEF